MLGNNDMYYLKYDSNVYCVLLCEACECILICCQLNIQLTVFLLINVNDV